MNRIGKLYKYLANCNDSLKRRQSGPMIEGVEVRHGR